MKDALEEAFAYLERVPKGTAVVSSGDAKKSLRAAGKSGPVHVNAKIWAEQQGLTITGDRPDLAVSNIFYFRRKE